MPTVLTLLSDIFAPNHIEEIWRHIWYFPILIYFDSDHASIEKNLEILDLSIIHLDKKVQFLFSLNRFPICQLVIFILRAFDSYNFVQKWTQSMERKAFVEMQTLRKKVWFSNTWLKWLLFGFFKQNTLWGFNFKSRKVKVKHYLFQQNICFYTQI